MVIKRIKKRLSKIMGRRKARKIAQLPRKKAPSKIKEEVLGMQETKVEGAKYSHPSIMHLKRMMPEELPTQYGKDKIVAQVRDPWWIHVYWEITPQTIEKIKNELKEKFYQAKRVLRVYDISHIIFTGDNAHRFFDIQINEQANNWYIDTAGPGRSWCVDLGLLLPEGKFITLVRSNTVYTPIEGPSWITDEEWMIPEEMFARLYGMGFGLGRSSPVGKAWQERVRRALFSGVLASPGIASMASPVKIPQVRKFWLVVNTELIVYGATEPDAKVSVQGKDISLRPDGTFSLRFALPDGKQVIPVQAKSADGQDQITITPIVTRETK